MRYKKQWFAGLLSIVMIISMLPVTAMAESVIPTEETKLGQVQASIDALPDADSITDDNRADVQAQIDAIAEAMLDLTEDEAAELDTTRYDAAVAALQALDDPTGDNGAEANADPDADTEASNDLDADPVSKPSALEQAQALIDALPDAGDITDDNRADVEAQLSAIDEAKLALTDDERALLDTARYDAAVSALSALDGQDGADVPMPIDYINGFEWTLDGSTITLTGEGELLLPSDAKPGQRLPFGITSVIVNGASSIGKGCFEDWSELRSVTLAPSVTVIGESAFSGCRFLELTELPESVTSIGESAFYGCRSLALTKLPSGLTTIEESAFYDCRSLALTELPASLKTIGDFAFESCDSLAFTEIPEGVTSIGDFAFLLSDGLTHLTLPASLESMGYYVFHGCENLTSLTFLGMTAPSIDPLAFGNANALQEILIPEGAAGYDADHGWPMDKIKVGHTVTVDSASGGSASAAPDYAGEGDAIVLTAVPDPGYHFVRWETEPAVTVTDNSFTMPNEDVTVTPVFEPHNFSSSWETSSAEHWHECACGEKQDEGEHTYSGGVCSVCGYSFECGIFVKTLSGDHITLTIKSTDTVRSVKEKIKENEGIPVSMQVLTLGGVELEDDRCLADCGVIKDSTLHLTLRYAPGGTGTADDPYLIPDKEQLEAFRYYINDMYGASNGGAGKYFKLTADIDLGGEKWTPIGIGYGIAFTGTFDGGGHTISGLNVNTPDYAGLFGVVYNGHIKNLTVAGTVTSTGGNDTGGIVATLGDYDVMEGSITNCHSSVTVTGSGGFTGGIVGQKYGSTVSGCTNTGSVSNSDDDTGGIAGANFGGKIENCYNTGAVSGTDSVGGIAGSNSGREWTAPAEIISCYNTGTVSGDINIGGILGLSRGSVTNCYYLDTCGAAGDGTPKTAAQFASGEVAWLLQNGQDPQVWGQTVGSGTPELTGSADKTVYQITGEVEGQDSIVWYSNRAATLPAAPERAGYAFEGWSTAKGGSVDFTAGAAVSGDMTVYAVFMDKRADGTGAVTMADYTCGDNSVDPVAESATNGTANVTYTYTVKGQDDYSDTKPTTAGEYTVKAVFAATDDYHAVTATSDFRITHQFNAGWEHRDDGDYHLCACGVGLLLETKELTEVPEGLRRNPDVDTVEKIERVLAEKVAAGEHYVIYDVELEALIDGEWQIITPESLPEEGVAITIPYPEGTSARYSFTVVHMFTTAGGGHVPGDTETLEATNGPDGIHFTVKSLSPIAIGWKAGGLTVTVTDTGENADPTQQWHFRVELDDRTISGEYGAMRFTDGVAEFTLRSGQSLTAQDLPEGVAYTVTELNGNQNGYTTTCTDDSGIITSEQDMTAAFVNDKPAPARPDDPTDEPSDPSDKPSDDKPGNSPNTGDESHLSLWLSLMILSLIGITAVGATSIIGRKMLARGTGRHTRK